ncbi:hypothetical protein SPRG_09888 [Saprolegnia parasitica CBS 223.65]|uniref:Uncharacterized protein n=1 Tax=Saprolegnia parasitica (strain CBS 223.65) TaxID=695850 RepID=A0A067CBS6_SAPPC|nr:hypothetical protein SPRG_09888 [Saprolegnia parasitica CBS 223.65]KDO24252.1 hypothetical protein SPRG_09888 [Saprolegnia parasitica CBS 223.65]|eukprot:XP_012205027.1 hypothetical protein SPRG_09888 [Saprolegnia parasitica CBS 223.65]
MLHLVRFVLLWYSHLLAWYHWFLARAWTSLDELQEDDVDLEAEGTPHADAEATTLAPVTSTLLSTDEVRSDNQVDDTPSATPDSLDTVLHMIDGYIDWLAASPRELIEVDNNSNNNQAEGDDGKVKGRADLTPEVDTEIGMTTTTLARTKPPANQTRSKPPTSKLGHLAAVAPAKGAKRPLRAGAESDARPRFVTVSRKRSYFSKA